LTASGIEPATFQLVAQYPNQLLKKDFYSIEIVILIMIAKNITKGLVYMLHIISLTSFSLPNDLIAISNVYDGQNVWMT
jgi:hypothetical protein